MTDIPAELWTHPALVEAVVEEDWGRVLRTVRRLTGISQGKLSEKVGLAQPDISAIERGHRKVTSAEVQRRIREGLGVPGGLSSRGSTGQTPSRPLPVSGLALPDIAPDEDLLTRVSGAVSGENHADAPTLDWLDRLLAEHRRAEDRIGSRPLVGIVHQQLRMVVNLYAQARGDIATRVVRLASEHAQFLAWMAQDQGASATAVAWYDRAHEWALEAADADMAATTLSMKAHLAWSNGHADRCMRLAEAAQWSSPGASRGVRGMAAQMAARGHALGGDASASQRGFDEAQALIGKAAERPEDEPAWMYFYGETWFTLQRGMAALHLRDWQSAVDGLRTGLGALPDEYRRDKTWYRSCLAHAFAGIGEAEQSLTTALATVPEASAIGRPHAWNELHTAAAHLLRTGARREARHLTDALRACD